MVIHARKSEPVSFETSGDMKPFEALKLPPVCDEARYRVVFISEYGDKSTYHLSSPINDREALKAFDRMFLEAHAGVYGEAVIVMALFSPERKFRRRRIASYGIQARSEMGN